MCAGLARRSAVASRVGALRHLVSDSIHQTLGVHCDGGLRPRFVLPARKLHPSPGLTPAENALVETLAIGCHAIDRAAARADETVLVIGAGPIGLAAVEFARLAGARVIVMDMVERRLAFALGLDARLGAASRVRWLDAGVVRMLLDEV